MNKLGLGESIKLLLDQCHSDEEKEAIMRFFIMATVIGKHEYLREKLK